MINDIEALGRTASIMKISAGMEKLNNGESADFIKIACGESFSYKGNVWFKLDGNDAVCLTSECAERKHFRYGTKVTLISTTLNIV